ncbi:hypothetical protein LINPERHAP1_LOCUS3389 [Linum perenne]
MHSTFSRRTIRRRLHSASVLILFSPALPFNAAIPSLLNRHRRFQLPLVLCSIRRKVQNRLAPAQLEGCSIISSRGIHRRVEDLASSPPRTSQSSASSSPPNRIHSVRSRLGFFSHSNWEKSREISGYRTRLVP